MSKERLTPEVLTERQREIALAILVGQVEYPLRAFERLKPINGVIIKVDGKDFQITARPAQDDGCWSMMGFYPERIKSGKAGLVIEAITNTNLDIVKFEMLVLEEDEALWPAVEPLLRHRNKQEAKDVKLVLEFDRGDQISYGLLDTPFVSSVIKGGRLAISGKVKGEERVLLGAEMNMGSGFFRCQSSAGFWGGPSWKDIDLAILAGDEETPIGLVNGLVAKFSPASSEVRWLFEGNNR